MLTYILQVAEELLKLKVHLTGTIMPNRKYLPPAIQKLEFPEKSTVAYKKKDAEKQTSCDLSGASPKFVIVKVHGRVKEASYGYKLHKIIIIIIDSAE